MEKPILATNIDGFLIDHKAFIEPHKAWFEKAIKITNDESLRKWIGHENYFLGVNDAMKKIMPKGTKKQQTFQARRWYQEAVIDYIGNNPEVINNKLKKYLIDLKQKFKLALITSNTKTYVGKILSVSGLENIYDIIHASETEHEPSKENLFESFNKKYGKPKYYIASRNKEPFELCKKFGIYCIYFSQGEVDTDLENISDKTIRNFDELK